MKIFAKVRGQCYCAFCRSPRRYYSKKHMDSTNVLAAAVFSSTVGGAVWSLGDPKAAVLFFLGLAFAEAFIYLRWRFSVVCHLCGFDPVLYKLKPESARDRVRQFYEERIATPEFQLTQSPLLELHRRQMEIQRLKQRLQRAKPQSSTLALAKFKTESRSPVKTSP